MEVIDLAHERVRNNVSSQDISTTPISCLPERSYRKGKTAVYDHLLRSHDSIGNRSLADALIGQTRQLPSLVDRCGEKHYDLR
jgi:hypothetical protein